jgi:hypothetical protein
MLGGETEQYQLCNDLYLQNASAIFEVETNGNSCTRVLNKNTLYKCLYE